MIRSRQRWVCVSIAGLDLAVLLRRDGGRPKKLPRRRPRRLPWVAVIGSVAALLGAHPAAAQNNFQLTAENCPVCSQAQIERWQFVSDHELGVAAVDPVASYVGTWRAEGHVFQSWKPQGSQKQTLCGTLDSFGFYNGGGDEADFNLHIRPGAQFQYLYDEVAARHHPTSEWRPDDGDGPSGLIEAEITPDEAFYENPWFSKTLGSPLEGRSLCVYGPWIGDAGHDYKPEIHPNELTWWRSGASAYLLNLQDDSNRFDRPGDFSDYPTRPSTWRPWAKFPRNGRFDIAVSLIGTSTLQPPAPLTSVPRLEIKTDKLIKPALNDVGDADNGAEHGIEYNRQLLMRVNEGGATGSAAEDNDIKVGFSFCRIPGTGTQLFRDRLLGYVTITTRVGDEDRGGPNGEGVHLLRVRRSATGPSGVATFLTGAPTVRPGSPPRVVARTRWITSSLRRVTVAGRPRLVADAEVRVEPVARTRAGDLAIANGRFSGGPVTLRRSGTGRTLRAALPVISGAEFGITTRSGQRTTGELPAVAPVLDYGDAVARTAPVAADPAVAAAAMGAPGKQLSGAQVANRWTLTINPQYAAVREGRPSLEDGAPISEELTRVLSRSTRARQALFGSARPMPVRWSFRAVNAATGQGVPVQVDRSAGSGEIGVRRSPGDGASSVIDVTFPDSGIYRLTATARTRDPFGKSATATHVLSNLVFGGGSRTDLATSVLTTLEQLAGLPPGQLVAASAYVLDPSVVPADRAARDAGAVRIEANDAARDQRLTLDELELLLGATRRFAEG